MTEPTDAAALRRFSYDPETGVLLSKAKKVAVGRPHKNRYLSVRIGVKNVKVHRIAWLLMTGEWPTRSIDHINGDGMDNRWCNLREANVAQNTCNAKAKPKKTTLPRGVFYAPKGGNGFQAMISVCNKKKYLGTFKTPELASEFYQLASEMVHGEFAWHLGAGKQIT